MPNKTNLVLEPNLAIYSNSREQGIFDQEAHMQTTAFGWIHTYEDYLKIFALSDHDLEKNIIIYPAGISNFVAKLPKRNITAVAADENYQMPPMEIDKYVSDRIHKLEEKLNTIGIKNNNKNIILQKARESAEDFKNDFPAGKLEGRYQAMQMPLLPVRNQKYEIALCPRCPLQNKDKNHNKALDIINELCRIAYDVRVFVSVSDQESFKHSLGPLLIQLQDKDTFITINDIAIKTPNTHTAMLRITQRSCNVNEEKAGSL
jgi:hypothetical protein